MLYYTINNNVLKIAGNIQEQMKLSYYSNDTVICVNVISSRYIIMWTYYKWKN